MATEISALLASVIERTPRRLLQQMAFSNPNSINSFLYNSASTVRNFSLAYLFVGLNLAAPLTAFGTAALFSAVTWGADLAKKAPKLMNLIDDIIDIATLIFTSVLLYYAFGAIPCLPPVVLLVGLQFSLLGLGRNTYTNPRLGWGLG